MLSEAVVLKLVPVMVTASPTSALDGEKLVIVGTCPNKLPVKIISDKKDNNNFLFIPEFFKFCKRWILSLMSILMMYMLYHTKKENLKQKRVVCITK